MRQIILDTETTGLEPEKGHRIIEVAALEMINRRFTGHCLHHFINPEREIDPEAQKVHGITSDFLRDKPLFSEIADELFDYINGSELIIHNAPFDLGFLDAEFLRYHQQSSRSFTKITDFCVVIDTLIMAREKHRGQKNNLDALCKRYQIDNSMRDLHDALTDVKLLGNVYLAMTGGQMGLFDEIMLNSDVKAKKEGTEVHRKIKQLKVILATADECAAHEAYAQ